MTRRALIASLLAVACTDATAPIALDTPSFTLTIGTSRQLSVLSGDRPLEGDAKVAWVSSDTSVAVVSPLGTVFGMKSGMTRVTARLRSRVSSADVRVIASTGGVWFAFAGDSTFTLFLNEVLPGGATTATVSGTMSLSNPRATEPLEYAVAGTHTWPSVTLQFTRTGTPAAAFGGGFTTDSTVVGELSGFGAARELLLTRPICYCPPLAMAAVAGVPATPCSPRLCVPAASSPRQ